MRLHELQLCAVGPFRGEETIDFSRLGATGLFLLEGPTGVGKSTIIDSIVFALYGSVAAEDATVSRMRSQHAAPTTESRVTLTFETSSGIYRVIRTPRYERPKQRGEGLRMQEATVKLFRLTSPDTEVGELISNRHDEANSEIARAIGLTKAQFTQTVVLPQGEFAAFLQAAPDARRELLARLFGTQLYDLIAAELATARREAHDQRATAQHAAEVALRLFADAADCPTDLTDLMLNAIGTPALPPRIEEIREFIAAASQTSAEQAHATRINADSERAEHNRAVNLAKLIKRREQLQQEQAVLATRLPEYESWKDDLARLTAAKPALTSLDLLITARAKLVDSERDLSVLQEGFADESLTSDELKNPAKAAGLRRAEIARLDELLACERAIPAAEQNLATKVAECAALTTDVAQLGEELAELPGAVDSANSALTEQRAAEAQIPGIAEKVERLRARAQAARDAAGVVEQIEAADTRLATARQEAAAAADKTALLTKRWVTGIAGELAEALEPGQPCPVCGSADHPGPTARSQEAATRTAVDEATTEQQVAAEAVTEALQSAAALQTSHAQFLVLSEGLSANEASANHATALAQLTRLQADAASIVDTQKRLAQLDAKQKSTSEALHTGREMLSAAEALVTTHQAQVERDRDRVEQARGPFSSVSDRVAEMAALADRLDSLESARTAVSSAQHLRDERANDFAAALTQANTEYVGLGSEANLAALKGALSALENLANSINNYDRATAAIQTQLSSSEFAGIEAVEPPDSAAIAARLAAAETTAKAAQDQATTDANRFDNVVAKEVDLLAADNALAATYASTAPILRAAEVANATSPDNLAKISLASFVLINRFERVISAANARLVTMSDGRYKLERREARESNNRKSGLGLTVHDLRTDKSRAPEDLSGGETFYTALALALGLADVVTSEAGGIELGTLFIDEGFGALDTATLDSVLSEIAKLHGGGRVVGVVSHVEELKSRISERIEIRQNSEGTSTLRVIC